MIRPAKTPQPSIFYLIVRKVIEYRRRLHRRDAVLPNLPGFTAIM
jgi:hypothetical protein